jgi:DNA-binding NarL/FixJ family response regulator
MPPQARTEPHRPFRLSPAELAVVALLAQGHTRTETATRLGMPPRTVRTHLDHAANHARTGHTQAGIIAAACRNGLLDHLPHKPRRLGRRPEHWNNTLTNLAAGLTDTQIAANLYLSVSAVRSRHKVLYRWLGAKDRAHAVLIAHQLGILPPAVNR